MVTEVDSEVPEVGVSGCTPEGRVAVMVAV